ncbi:hypothetical protein MRY82_08090 [bacterium]|nr:hypothetical protein [bacterium]
MKRLLVFGFGNLAYETLRIVTARTNIELWIISRNYESVKKRINHLKLTNAQINKYSIIKFKEGDLNNSDQISTYLSEISPDYILQTAPLRPLWKNSNSKRYAELKSVLPGAWYPFLAPNTIKLMKILNDIKIKTDVINACYPDVTNPVLKRYDMSPSIGIGNIANSVPAIKYSIADFFNVNPEKINLKVAGHHAAGFPITRSGTTNGAPIYIKANIEGRSLDIESNKNFILKNTYHKFQRITGLEGQTMTAHSAASVILTKLGFNLGNIHAPGINGLEGGYPINPSTNSVHYDNHNELNEMIRVNIEGQKYDGIEKIDAEGTVHFTKQCQDSVRSILGMPLESCKINDIDIVGNEMNRILDSF